VRKVEDADKISSAEDGIHTACRDRQADRAREAAPPRTASLFDVATPAALPTAPLAESEEDLEPFAETEDDEHRGEDEDLDEVA
jgi:hypothetical protein